MLKNILTTAEQLSPISDTEIDELCAIADDDLTSLNLLYQTADRVRHKTVGDAVHLRGLIEFSNTCCRNCLYCGLRSDNTNLQRYHMPPEEIIATAINAEKLDYKSIVMQSGEDNFYSVNLLAEIISTIKSKTKLAVTLSAGEFSLAEYQQLRAAGTDRYLLRFETSDPDLYQKLHPDSTLTQRLQCLQYLGETGYQVGTGFMVGLPGETPEIYAENLKSLRRCFNKNYHVDMVGIGPFLANPETPLKKAPNGGLHATLKAVAITRLILPYAHIPATTALGTLHKDGRKMALFAGANVMMPNVTPMKYREKYMLYPNKIGIENPAEELRERAEQLVYEIGRTVAIDVGDAMRNHVVS